MKEKKKEFYDKKEIETKDLYELVDRIILEDDMIFEENEDYKGTRISLVELNATMNRMLNISEEIRRQRKKNIISLRNDGKFNYSGEDIYYFLKTPTAIRYILDFLKDFDSNIYIQTLEMVIGLKEESIEIYNEYDKRVKNNSLPNHSINISDNGIRRIYLPLREDFDEEAEIELSNIIDRDSFLFPDLFKLMHEIAHGFAVNPKSESLSSDEFIDERYKEKLPTITGTYLSETTAIMFEELFGEYLCKKIPEYKPLVDQIKRHRINSNLLMIKETGTKSALVRRVEDGKKLDDRFMDMVKNYYGLTSKGLNNLFKDPYLYSSREYALAQLLVPTIIDEYKKDENAGKEKVKNYLECCKNNDFDGALLSFGIDLNNIDSYNHLLNVYKQYLYDNDIRIAKVDRDEEEK